MYTFALAERLGMTRGRLLAEMDSAEITGWMAFDRVRSPNPVEFLLAHACTILAQLGGNKQAKPARFLPWLKGLRKGGTTISFKGGRKKREG